MDDGRFDGLARSFGRRRPRRSAAGALASLPLAGLFGHLGGEQVAAKKKDRKCRLKCPVGMIAAGGICVTGRGTCQESACGKPVPQGLCNNARDCRCATAVNGGLRCGKAPVNLEYGQCTTDSQCAAVLGRGAFCVPATQTGPGGSGLQCTCPQLGQGFCLLPCYAGGLKRGDGSPHREWQLAPEVRRWTDSVSMT